MTTYAKAKKQVWAIFSQEKVRMTRDAKVYMTSIWHQTIGNFFRQYGGEADAKWNRKKVNAYALSATRAIAREAKKKAGGGTVDAYHLDEAASEVIKAYRKHCPVDVRPNNMGGGGGGTGGQTGGAVLHGALCELF